ncbi:hypothetical protein BASA61_002317 [Batrachochytrium salamandrivorans]|nr:hypothetical protein BASA62_009116 [Batrachochytrium salamandrivorans]KAH6574969.1 hypothetical protein BASA60_005228 [Batrachochytrium salamandrivorans]KAH6600314.1 hypothetical protein BASA61_002317 [Batrachochytrium salamandrivorans]KAH9248184.1 hypothetical protein BASA81_014177 [Batrachochytrium salamandrivorans]KAH9266259.1 hypothetical protein BASA83_010737 [Batrachochytrium salamandrivorans]
MFLCPTVVVALIAAAPSALAWGNVTHSNIARVADALLTDEARLFVNTFLPSNETLFIAANWADQVRSLPGFAPWSANLHFVGPLNNPPAKCGYIDDRDCKDGNCIVGAIANYTMRASCDSGVDATQHTEALRFIIHFLGDIAQPLHVCGRGRGGNDQNIWVDGRNVSFHSAWDVAFPEKIIATRYNGSSTQYADSLVQRIQTGDFKSKTPGWISVYPYTARNHNNNSLAAIDWATDSDELDCSVVWPAYDADPTQDFGGAYFESILHIVDLQIAKAGFRLANWLDQIAVGSCKTGTLTPSATSAETRLPTSSSSPTETLIANRATSKSFGAMAGFLAFVAFAF